MCKSATGMQALTPIANYKNNANNTNNVVLTLQLINNIKLQI